MADTIDPASATKEEAQRESARLEAGSRAKIAFDQRLLELARPVPQPLSASETAQLTARLAEIREEIAVAEEKGAWAGAGRLKGEMLRLQKRLAQ